MFLSKLPCELILEVGDHLPISAHSCLLRTCRSMYQLLGPALTTRITTEDRASSVLLSGISSNHLPTVNLALAHNAAWHTEHTYGHCLSAMEHACDLNRLDIVGLLITHYGPTILAANQTPSGGRCHADPLRSAVRANNLPLTTILLEAGAPANRTVWYGYPSSDKSPLDCAAKFGSAPIAEVLIRHGADVPHDTRSLSYAVHHGTWDVARVLLREGVMISDHNCDWCDRAPLGERSPSEIEAWLTAGAEHMQKCIDQDRARRIAANEWKLKTAAAFRTF